MQTLLLLSVLAQAPVVAPAVKAVGAVSTPRTFSDGQRSYKLYESLSLIAEPSPSDEVAAKVKSLDPSATVVLEKATMRVWKVTSPATLRAAVPSLRPAFHDVASGAGRFRVPVALVCDGVREAASWEQVLERSGARCLPDFWYPPTLR